MTVPPPRAPARREERPRDPEFAPRPRQPSRPRIEAAQPWEERAAAIAAREAREVVDDLLRGLDQRIVDLVDGRMRDWIEPVGERISEIHKELRGIARQQGADLEARIEHERYLAAKKANEEADRKIHELEEEFRKERSHFVRLSVDLTERQKVEQAAREMPRKAKSDRAKVAASLVAAVALLLSALGASSVWSQCRGPSRDLNQERLEKQIEKVHP